MRIMGSQWFDAVIKYSNEWSSWNLQMVLYKLNYLCFNLKSNLPGLIVPYQYRQMLNSVKYYSEIIHRGIFILLWWNDASFPKVLNTFRLNARLLCFVCSFKTKTKRWSFTSDTTLT